MKIGLAATASALVAALVFASSPVLAGGGGTGGGGTGGGGGGTATGGGGGGGGLGNLGANNITVVKSPLTGENEIAFPSGISLTNAPHDAIVSLDGVQITCVPGSSSSICGTGPKPTLGADNILHFVVSSASTKNSLTLDLPCPLVAVGTTPSAGTSINGVSTVTMTWTPLPFNTPFGVNLINGANGTPRIKLFAYDSVSNQIVAGDTAPYQLLDQAATSATYPVQPVTASGYILELQYPGPYVLDGAAEGGSGGFCTRKIRTIFTN